MWPNQAFLKDVHQAAPARRAVRPRRVLGQPRPAAHRARVRGAAPTTARASRCTPAASCRSTSAPACVTPNMHRRLVSRRARPADRAAARTAAGGGRSPASGGPIAARRCGRRTSPIPTATSRRSTRFATPAQRRLIFEDFFVYQTGLALRRRQNAAVRKPHVGRRRRRAARAGPGRVLPFKLTEGQRDGAARHRRRHAAAAGRCSGCCRATSDPARPSSPSWPRSWRWRTASRWR